jgi:hypothetical protein
MADPAGFELANLLSRIQKQMLSLLGQFQLCDSLISEIEMSGASETEKTEGDSVLLTILKIISNLTNYARSVVSTGGNSSKFCKLGEPFTYDIMILLTKSKYVK